MAGGPNQVITDLRKSLAWLDLALASLDEGVLVMGRDMKILFANDAMAKMFKTNRIYLLGSYVWDILPIENERRRILKRDWLGWLQKNRIQRLSGEYRLSVAKKKIDIELTIGYITNTKQAILVVNDITQKRQAEIRRTKLIREQVARNVAQAGQKRFLAQYQVARILESSPNLEVAASRILRVLCRSLGWQAGALWTIDKDTQKLRCLKIWHAPNAKITAFIKASNEMQLPRGKGLPGRIWRHNKPVWVPDVTKDKNFPRASVAAKGGLRSGLAFPIGEKSDFIGVVEFFSDRIEKPNRQMLTGMATIGIQIAQFVKRKELERQKDDFIGIASHELKTPVTSLKAYAQVMQRQFSKSQDAKAAQNMAKINAQLDKLMNLIEDLLDITKLEIGKLQFNLSWFDFNRLAQSVVEEMSLTSEVHKISLKGSVDRKVYADKERIRQVLVNMIDNAIKYSPRGGKIDINLKSSSTELTVSVRDHGVGISEEKQSQVFERFFRVSGPQAKSLPGLGLGLFISGEIIKRLGGRIWLKSHLGKGSTFYFSLPFVQPTGLTTTIQKLVKRVSV